MGDHPFPSALVGEVAGISVQFKQPTFLLSFLHSQVSCRHIMSLCSNTGSDLTSPMCFLRDLTFRELTLVPMIAGLFQLVGLLFTATFIILSYSALTLWQTVIFSELNASRIYSCIRLQTRESITYTIPGMNALCVSTTKEFGLV